MPANKIYVFAGKIVKVDAPASTFTLSGDGRLYVFHVSGETKITWTARELKFADLKPGQEAEVEMKMAPSGEGLATSVKLASPWTPAFSGPRQGLSTAMAESLWAATTVTGKRLSAGEIKPLILSSQWPQTTHSVIGYLKLKPGVFLLSVRSDGGVEKVEILQSVGHKGVDSDMVKSLSKWRFRPNSVKEVRVPVQYAFNR